MAHELIFFKSHHFQVEWGGSRVGFSEVTGLSAEVQVIEYREGIDSAPSSRKLPGLKKYGNITFKRGIVSGDNELFEWFNTVGFSAERRDLRVSLLNEEHSPVMIWRITNAFPVKISGPNFNALSGDVAIETLEVAHEGLSIEIP